MRGGQRQALLLMLGLRDGGHSCQLLARAGSPLWQAAAEAGFPVSQATLPALRRYSRDVELVHAHDAHAHTMAAVASHGPVLVSRRVAFPIARNLFSRWKYSRPRRFLAVSQFVADELVEAGVARDKIDVVYDAVDLTPPAAASDLLGSNFHVVTLASHDPAKARDLAEQSARLANVELIFSQDLAHDLPHASIFLYLSRSEGFGSAALLAMNYALPVIASRTGGLVEIVVHGETGLLVDNEPAAIAAALRELAEDPKLRHQMGCQGRRRVEQHFTRAHLIESTLVSYAKALDVR